MTNLPPELEAQARELARKHDKFRYRDERDHPRLLREALGEMAQRTLEWAANELEANCWQGSAHRLRSLAGQEERDGK